MGYRIAMYKITKNDIKYCDFWTKRYCLLWGFAPSADDRQTGYEAMCKAVTKFNPEKGTTFWTYAKYLVHAYLYRAHFSGAVFNNGQNYSCVYRNNLQVPIERVVEKGKKCRPSQRFITNTYELPQANKTDRNLEDEYIKFEKVQKLLRTMLPAVQIGVINKALYGIDYQDTAVKIGFSKKSVGVMKEQWSKNTSNAKLDRVRQKKYYGNQVIEYQGV